MTLKSSRYNKHIVTLKKIIPNEKIPFYSVIVFYGDCQLKEINFIPAGTYITMSCNVLNVVDYILNNNENANYTDKRNILNTLTECVKNGESKEIRNKHVEHIQDMKIKNNKQ